MRVCLINPMIDSKYNMDPEPHLGLAYIASFLKKNGYSVDIIDAPIEGYIHQQIIEALVLGNYDAIGISCYYFNYLSAYKLMKDTRRIFSQSFIFAGGYLPTLAHEKMRNDLKIINCCVIGEGEKTTLSLLENLKNNCWQTTPSIAYLKDNTIFITEKAVLIDDLDELPFPVRQRKKENAHIVDLIASRGCYGQCKFCSIHEFYQTCKGRKVRQRSPENVVNEIELLIETLDVRCFNFVDDNFYICSKSAQKWFYEFKDLIVKKGIKTSFHCNFRANEIIAQKEIVKDFIEIGLVRVFVGVESLLDSHLAFYGKNVTAKENIAALEVLDELEVNYDIGFLLYNPITTIEDIIQTVETLRQIRFNHRNQNIIRPFSAAVVNSVYGTQLNAYIIDNGLYERSSKGYFIKEQKARICYEVAKKWKEKTDFIYRKRWLYDVAEDTGDREMMESIKKTYYDLFQCDLNILEEIARSLSSGVKSSTACFKNDYERWYSYMTKKIQALNKIEINIKNNTPYALTSVVEQKY